jgi:hypothetical protein
VRHEAPEPRLERAVHRLSVFHMLQHAAKGRSGEQRCVCGDSRGESPSVSAREKRSAVNRSFASTTKRWDAGALALGVCTPLGQVAAKAAALT